METRILVLGNSVDRALYRPVDEWSRYFGDVPFDAVQMPQDEPTPPMDRYTHLLVTGSDASLTRPEPWFEREANVIREAAGHGLAILGSCFGHQMLAWALSGPQYVRSALTPEVGWIPVDILHPDPLFADCPNPWHSFAAHLDEVVSPPPPWRILAATPACPVQAMRYGDHPIWGIQPHPETTPQEAVLQMENGIAQYPEYTAAIRQAIEAPVRDDRVTPMLCKAFLGYDSR